MMVRIGPPLYGGAFQGSPEEDSDTIEGLAPRTFRFVLPGERVAGEPVAGEEADGSAAILEPSRDRVAPACRHFGRCGGCDYQHAAYTAQMKIKQEILAETMRAAGLSQLPVVEAHPSVPWEYRNRVRMRVEVADGLVQVGYHRRGSRAFLPVTECPIASPLLWRAAGALMRMPRSNGMVAGWLDAIAEVEFQTTIDEASLQMTVYTRERRIDGFAGFCEALFHHLPELTGAGALAVTAGYGAKERVAWGRAGLAHGVLGENFWVTRGGFFQVNRHLLPALAELVTKGQRGDLAWDLYAGVGLFARLLARSFGTVTAVEAAPLAAGDLAQAARKNAGLRAVNAETSDFLRRAVLERDRPDLIVMDPPRAGLGGVVCALLARVGCPRMVYVSCDPNTLARDLKMLVDSGYRIEQQHLLDMFPQTFHIESVVFLEK